MMTVWWVGTGIRGSGGYRSIRSEGHCREAAYLNMPMKSFASLTATRLPARALFTR